MRRAAHGRRRVLAGVGGATLAAFAAPGPARAAPTASGLATDPRLGVYRGAGCEGRPRIAEFGAWLGRMPAWATDFIWAAGQVVSWQDIRASWDWAAGCWRGAPYRLALAMPMLAGDRSATLADGARGACDAHILHIARRLVEAGHGNAVMRIGWEFNGSWSHWDAAADPPAFIAYWRRIVALMRGVPRAAFSFDWNPNLGLGSIAPDRVWPGDDVVDVIGLDVYNQSWRVPRPTPEARWHELRTQPYGLDWHRAFAAARGKPRSFPEWGTGLRPDGSGGGDDPHFIAAMAAWLRAPDVAYHGYWDFPAEDYNARISAGAFPQAAAMFRREFGAAPAIPVQRSP
jgi:hypothetical protein